MFVSKNIVFVELHKTGCTHIGRLLAAVLDGTQAGKHNRPSPLLLASNRKFLGSIRNPLDWYVSLWAYGCSGKGLVYSWVTRPLSTDTPRASQHPGESRSSLNSSRADRKPDLWKRCYSDVHSPRAFRDWLRMMNDKNHWHDFGEGYGDSPISRISGLMTYRYVTLFWRDIPAVPTTATDLLLADAENCFIDHFIRMERLEIDLMTALTSCGVTMSAQQIDFIKSAGKTNASGDRAPAESYYDSETAEMVLTRDRLIVDKFGYATSRT